jgi:hypothetical protein
VLTAAKKDKLAKQYEDTVEWGEVKVKGKTLRTVKAKKARKGLSVEDNDDKGEEEGDNGGSDTDHEDEACACKTAMKRKCAAMKGKSTQKLPERDKDTSDDETDERAPCKAAKAKRKPPECDEDTGDDEEDECH